MHAPRFLLWAGLCGSLVLFLVALGILSETEKVAYRLTVALSTSDLLRDQRSLAARAVKTVLIVADPDVSEDKRLQASREAALVGRAGGAPLKDSEAASATPHEVLDVYNKQTHGDLRQASISLFSAAQSVGERKKASFAEVQSVLEAESRVGIITQRLLLELQSNVVQLRAKVWQDRFIYGAIIILSVVSLVVLVVFPGALLLRHTVHDGRRLQTRNERLALIASAASNSIILTDAELRIEWVNKGFEELIGRTFDEVVGSTPFLAFGCDRSKMTEECAMSASIRETNSFKGQVEVCTACGRVLCLSMSVDPLYGADGSIDGYVWLQQDVTALVEARNFIENQTTILEDTSRLAKVGGWEYSPDTDTLRWSDEVFRIHETSAGYIPTVEQAIDFFSPDSRDEVAKAWTACIAYGTPWDLELPFVTQQGRKLWVRVQGRPQYTNGVLTRVYGMYQDLTDRKRLTEEIIELAKTDCLTGLPNRSSLCGELAISIDQWRNGNGPMYALIYLDLDRFKAVNDNFGHGAGDNILRLVARRLERILAQFAKSDLSAVAGRLSGDEFVILLRNVTSEEQASWAARLLLQDISKPYNLGGITANLTASIGIACAAPSHEVAEDVLRDGDAAMFEAKGEGKNRCAAFVPNMRQKMERVVALEAGLREAVEKGEFSLVYQPIVDIVQGELEGFEALLRWRHPVLGPVSPAEFIPIAEETGLIIPIGEWVLERACSQYAEWCEAYPNKKVKHLSVNVDRRQILAPRFVETVLNIVDRHVSDPSAIHIEITENGVMEDVDGVNQALHEIRKRGIQVDLDDFGTGHSSLACLNDLPINVLKLDRAFIVRRSARKEDAQLIGAVIGLAKSLNISVVAEGIETEEHLVLLQSLGCEFGQGYFWSPPVTGEKALAFISDPSLLFAATKAA